MFEHSIETNLKYYSYAQKDYLDNVRALLDEDEPAPETEWSPPGPPQTLSISKKESPKHLNYQVF